MSHLKHSSSGSVCSFLFLTICMLTAAMGFAQTQSPSSNDSAGGQSNSQQTSGQQTNSQQSNAPEVSENPHELDVGVHDSNTAFRVPVNLVLVRVVVRDGKGKIVGNLKKEDFRLFDNRKPQVISHFSAETPAPHAAITTTAGHTTDVTPADTLSPRPLERPTRFMALLFDDSDLNWQDLIVARKAATNFVNKSMQPADRVALYTVSGQNQVDFTDDGKRIVAAMNAMMARPISPVSANGTGECPNMNYYEADLIENQHDAEALDVAAQDTIACEFNNDQRYYTQAQAIATSTAPRILNAGRVQADYATRRVDEVLRRISAMPGQRSIILVSPGFMVSEDENDVWRIIDRANRAGVTVNTLDARGLYTPDMGDVSQEYNGSPIVAGKRLGYAIAQQTQQSNVMRDLADGTGATFFHNSNDLDAGFQLLMKAPETSYLLGFSPTDFKPDGKFHTLKVSIEGNNKYDIQARRGYFSAKKSANSTDIAKQEIEEAVFSQEEVHDLPVELHTQFYKTDSLNAKLAVMTHLDVGRMQFKKEDGRNRDSLTIVAALFDRNGNYITGSEKVLEMRLRDATLEKLGHQGLTVKSSFDVKPGQYVVRLVARDSEAARLSAENGTVEIPY